MSVVSVSWLIAASILLLLAHVLRAARQSTLFPQQYGVRRFDLLLGLAISYAMNSILPFHVGELVRVIYVGRSCRIRYPFVAASVLAERLADLLVVAIFYAALAFLPSGTFHKDLIFFSGQLLLIAAVGLFVAFATSALVDFRRVLWSIFSIFNHQIRFFGLDLSWSYTELITGGLAGRGRFLLLTPIMWAFYGLSYVCFAQATQASLRGIVLAMLGSPLRSTVANFGSRPPLWGSTLSFALVPVVGVLMLGLLRGRTKVFRTVSSLLTGRSLNALLYKAPVSDRFRETSEYEAFLISRFSRQGSLLTEFSLRAMSDGAVQRIFPGGSDAVTALVEVGGHMLIRKFAVGGAAEKLHIQANWLKRYRSSMPLVDVTGAAEPGGSFFTYDMPYIPTAVDFYDVIHTDTLNESKRLLSCVVDHMLDFHERHALEPATPEAIGRYLQEKAVSNARKTLEAAEGWLPYDSSKYMLNGREFDISDWRYVQDMEWLRSQITRRGTAVIHGDLTIENIIVCRDVPTGFYIIDPNPDNIFDTPLIDWAKLMQSLHLGYENLNRAPTATLKNGQLSLVLTRSDAYNQLHSFCLAKLTDAYGPDIQREISFHEIINYLRLTPYKIRQSPSKGLAFFACTSLLIRDYLETYS